eukprot:7323695-Pyramimonas_sp.AAC.1
MHTNEDTKIAVKYREDRPTGPERINRLATMRDESGQVFQVNILWFDGSSQEEQKQAAIAWANAAAVRLPDKVITRDEAREEKEAYRMQ